MLSKRNRLICLLLFFVSGVHAQDSSFVLTEDEFVGLVRKYHPVVKQADIQVARAGAELQMARGSFDPSINAGLDRKSFDGKLYYSYFNPQVNIPTWYGVDIKAGVEEVIGNRVSPEATLGQTSYVGVKLTAANIIFDKRRAVLTAARSFVKQTEAERALTVNDLINDALSAYWNWVREYQSWQIMSAVVKVNEERLQFVRLEYEQGARPAIDTTEVLAQLQNFYYQHDNAWMSFLNAGLELSNYLWLDNNQPLVWSEQIRPAAIEMAHMQQLPAIEELLAMTRSNHPKLRSVGYKIDILETDRRLKAISIFPKLSINANLLGKGYGVPDEVKTPLLQNNYKAGVDLSVPLFLREARGAYRSATLKLNDARLTQDQVLLQLENKVKSYYNDVVRTGRQVEIYEQAYNNYLRLLSGERLRFETGESSLFLLNSRETKVLEAAQKLQELKVKWNKSYVGLLWATGQLSSL